MSLFSESSGADFSACKKYRYALWRVWDYRKPICMFLMLNPSTANATSNDPTVERCVRRAMQMGYGGLHVANLFAFRSTDPKELYRIGVEPVGMDNDSAILEASLNASTVICAWGRHGYLHGRANHVVGMLRDAGIELKALGINNDGSPAHPLYLDYAAEPQPFLI